MQPYTWTPILNMVIEHDVGSLVLHYDPIPRSEWQLDGCGRVLNWGWRVFDVTGIDTTQRNIVGGAGAFLYRLATDSQRVNPWRIVEDLCVAKVARGGTAARVVVTGPDGLRLELERCADGIITRASTAWLDLP